MARALIGAQLSRGLDVEIFIYDISQAQISLCVERFIERFKGLRVAVSPEEMIRQCDLLVLSVKPQVLPLVLKEIRELPDGVQGAADSPLYVSIAAGVTLATLAEGLPGARVCRVMPNTPALVGEAASGYSLGAGVTNEDRELLLSILESCGIAVEVSEREMEIVTGLSGSGPAFFARIAESFIKIGEEMGLTGDVSRALVLQTMLGTASILMKNKLEPDTLIDMVSSPGGTTVAGREVLEHSNLGEILAETVKRAVERGRELGL